MTDGGGGLSSTEISDCLLCCRSRCGIEGGILRGGNLNGGGTGRVGWPEKGAEGGGKGFAILPLRREDSRNIMSPNTIEPLITHS